MSSIPEPEVKSYAVFFDMESFLSQNTDCFGIPKPDKVGLMITSFQNEIEYFYQDFLVKICEKRKLVIFLPLKNPSDKAIILNGIKDRTKPNEADYLKKPKNTNNLPELEREISRSWNEVKDLKHYIWGQEDWICFENKAPHIRFLSDQDMTGILSKLY